MEGDRRRLILHAEWVDWFKHRRLLEPIGDIPPAEFEAAYYGKEETEETDGLKDPSLR